MVNMTTRADLMTGDNNTICSTFINNHIFKYIKKLIIFYYKIFVNIFDLSIMDFKTDSCILNGTLVTFCQSTNFKNSVQNIIRTEVNNELFWRDLFTNLNLDSKIKNQLDQKIPNLVKKEANRIIKKKVDLQLKDYSQQIPHSVETLVTKELNKQITNYLNNHSHMKLILQNQSNDLKNILELTSKEILIRIVNEDKYHEVTNAHHKAINDKYNEQIKHHKDKIDNQIRQNASLFQDQLKKMIQSYDHEMAQLKKKLDDLDSLNHQIIQLKKQILNSFIFKKKIIH